VHVNITSRPAYSIAYLRLDAGESVFCEAGAMVAMSGGVEASATLPGGVVRAAVRRVIAQESLVMSRFTARIHGAWVAVAPRFPGDVSSLAVEPGNDICLQSGALLAHSAHVDVAAGVGNIQTLALREGATVLRASGAGELLVAAYGALERFDLRDGEQLVIDSGHVAAWTAGMQLRIGPLKGLVSAQLTGEGLVGEFTGPGTVFVQTRAEQQLRSWLFPERGQDRGQ
jgi:uncharacterized protein (TIGR00266 family)